MIAGIVVISIPLMIAAAYAFLSLTTMEAQVAGPPQLGVTTDGTSLVVVSCPSRRIESVNVVGEATSWSATATLSGESSLVVSNATSGYATTGDPPAIGSSSTYTVRDATDALGRPLQLYQLVFRPSEVRPGRVLADGQLDITSEQFLHGCS
jgi:hypothetical protein